MAGSRAWIFSACCMAFLALGAGLPFYEIRSVSNVQDSLLTTRYYEPDLFLRNDYAAEFDGKEHVAIPKNTNQDLTISLSMKSFTLELWVRHNRPAQQDLPGYFISQGDTGNTEHGSRLLVGFQQDHTFECSFYDGLNLVTRDDFSGDMGQWHHWALTFDEDTMQRVVYRDGVMVASDIASTQLIASSGLKMGYAYDADLQRDVFFDGALDEVRIWETVLEIETIRTYASLTSAWITDFHPNVAYLLAYFDFNEGSGSTSEDSGPVRYDADLVCSSTGDGCSSSSLSRFWSSGVGHRSLVLGNQHRIHKICPTPSVSYLDYNNTWWTYPDYERRGETKPLPYCTTDLQHRHEVLCSLDFTLHIAYQKTAVEGFPKYHLCDGVKWMPVFYDHQIWNNFMLPS